LRRSSIPRSLTGIVALAACLAGPALADPQRAPGVDRLADARVLVLPMRVEVYENATAGQGVLKLEPTENARQYVQTALETVLGRAPVVLVKYEAPSDRERNDRHLEMLQFHTLVRSAILRHLFNDVFWLPSKRGRLEWSLGSGASILRDNRGDTRYGLFVELIERRMSRGWLATSAALGSDRLMGVASLVDLGTGDVLWFNQERGGSLETANDTLTVLKRLLRDVPF